MSNGERIDRLVLFDIDATLIATGGLGMRAILSATQELFGAHCTSTGIEYAGRLDPLIIGDLLRGNGVAATPENAGRLRETYRRHLVEQLRSWENARALPGALDLLAQVERLPGVTMGLLTGNFPETGAIKLRACGIDPGRFGLSVWGDESPHSPPARDHLPAVALGRLARDRGRAIEPSNAIVIGDTPHDVSCALVNGCRCIGVATGRYTIEDLSRAGAHLALPDLTDGCRVVDFIRSAGVGAPSGGSILR